MSVSLPETQTYVKMAMSGPYIHTHQNITNYITIVSRVNYTLIQTCINQNVSYMFDKIYNQIHKSAFFSKAVSSERRLPEYSLYLKGGSHDGVSNAH